MSNWQYNNAFHKRHYDTLVCKFRKDENIITLLEYAAELEGTSKTDYVRKVLKEKFEQDGITIDRLEEGKRIESTKNPKPKKKDPKMAYMLTTTYIPTGEEKYLSVFSSIKSAKSYARMTLSTKPYPKQWKFTVYGRYFNVPTKREAENRYRRRAKFIVNCFKHCWMYVAGDLKYCVYDFDGLDYLDEESIELESEDFDGVESDFDDYSSEDWEEFFVEANREIEEDEKKGIVSTYDIEGWEEWKKEHIDFIHELEEKLGKPAYVEVFTYKDILSENE